MLLLFSTSFLIDFIPRRIAVVNKEHQVIGEAVISHNYSNDHFLLFSFLILSGIQLWSIHSIGRGLYESRMRNPLA